MIPDPNRDPEDPYNNLSFNYSVRSVEEGNTLKIKVDFEYPTDISTKGGYDRLKVKINRDEFRKVFLVIGEGNRILEMPPGEKINTTTLNLPLQKPADGNLKALAESIEEANDNL